MTGEVIGTLDYIAPQHIQTSSTVDGQADLYAVAIITCEMLSGQPLYGNMRFAPHE
jgi:serine/threonine protein kinase